MERTPLTSGRRSAYAAANAVVAPVWLAMILAPRSTFTRWLVERATALLVGLGFAYDGLLLSDMVREGRLVDYGDPEAVRAALGRPDVFLAGWVHYLAFDLFVGRWIWQDALATGRTAPLALTLTFLAGPAGLSLYLLGRGR